MFRPEHALLLLVLVFLILCIGSCRGNGEQLESSVDTQVQQSLMPLPNLDQVLHATSTTVHGAKANGSDFINQTNFCNRASCTPTGNKAILSPEYETSQHSPFSDAAFCIYRFDLTGYQDTASLNYNCSQTPASWEMVYIGLGNWNSNVWEWNIGEETNHIDFESLEPYVSDTNELVLAMVILGTEDVQIDYIQIGGNIEPIAQLTADPSNGEAPLSVHLDGSTSFDDGGQIVNYEWDVEGDGTFEQAGETLAEIDHQYTNAGSYSATLRVTDIHGAWDIATVPITVTAEPSGTWHLVRADDGNQETGWYADLEEVAGYPAVAYLDHKNTGTPGEVRYIRALDAQGSTWGVPIILGECGQYGGHISLCVVDGNPAVSYDDEPNKVVIYRRSNDATGSTWGDAVEVASNIGSRPGMTLLSVVGGHPAIAYVDNYNDLHYIRAEDSNGASWPENVVAIDISHKVGDQGALLIAGGKPLIAYLYDTYKDIRIARAQDASGIAWSDPETVIDTSSIGVYMSASMVGDNPALAYTDGSSHDVLYTRALDAMGTSWTSPVTINTVSASNRKDVCLAIISGKPAMSYYDQDNGKLVYSRSSDAFGLAWAEPQVVDNHWYDTTGWYGSLKLVAGQPCIAYYNFTQGALQFAALY